MLYSKIASKSKRYSKPKLNCSFIKIVIRVIGVIIIPLGLFVGFTNYNSAKAAATDPTYNTNGEFNVYGVTTSGKTIFIGKVEKIDHLNYENTTIRTVNNEDLVPEIVNTIEKIQISYTKKISGNIGLSSLIVTDNLNSELLNISDFSYQTYNEDPSNYEFILTILKFFLRRRK